MTGPYYVLLKVVTLCWLLVIESKYLYSSPSAFCVFLLRFHAVTEEKREHKNCAVRLRIISLRAMSSFYLSKERYYRFNPYSCLWYRISASSLNLDITPMPMQQSVGECETYLTVVRTGHIFLLSLHGCFQNKAAPKKIF